MLYLSNQYAAATTEAQRDLFLAAGEAALAAYRGTAFDVYYVLNDGVGSEKATRIEGGSGQ